MLRHTLAVPALAFALLVPALLRADDPPKGDKELDGDWELQATIEDGKEREKTEMVYTIKGNNLSVAFLGTTIKGTVKLDVTKKPKTMDLTVQPIADRGATLDIYEVIDDQLRICEAALGKDRPTDFTSKEGSGRTLLVLKRVKK